MVIMLDDAESISLHGDPDALAAPMNFGTLSAEPIPGHRPRWYCLVTKPGQETRAAKAIRKAGFLVFCPLIERPLRRAELRRQQVVAAVARAARKPRGRPLKPPKPEKVPALRGYVLVLFDARLDPWGQMRWLPGVAAEWVLCMEPGVPVAIPHRQVVALQQAIMQGGAQADGIGALIEAGAELRILAGPMQGHRAVCLEHDGDAVVLTATLFGRTCRLTLSRGDVEPA